MKNRILVVSLALMSVGLFAQKDELKSAEKALKKGDYKTAMAAVKSLDAMEASMDSKYKAKYYFLKGQAYSTTDLATAGDAFNKLMSFEKEIGKNKYSSDAQKLLTDIENNVGKEAMNFYNSKDFLNASKKFYLKYKINNTDTTALYNAAVSAGAGKDLDLALKHYRKLLDLNYTDIGTLYMAVNKKTGKKENLSTKMNQSLYVKSGQYINPTVEVSESKKPEIIKRISLILIEQDKTDEAIKAIKDARELNPGDVSLIQQEAFLYLKLKEDDKFSALMEEAIKLTPNDPNLYFNIGVIAYQNQDIPKALKYYDKAIEIDANYRNAYLNAGIAILAQTDALAEEMGKNFQNEKKYFELEKQRLELLKKALPYIEKGDNLKRDLETVRQLVSIYDILEMTEKADQLRPIFKKMREEQKQ